MEVPYHYQFRIIVIGDTMVGKSSLLKTFSEGTFGEMEPTVGVDFFSKIIEIRSKQNQADESHVSEARSESEENIIIKMQIWDTAGQERFKSIVTSYYRNSVGIVLVYDITNRESFEHLIDWFTEACNHVEPGPSPTLAPLDHNNISYNNMNQRQHNHFPFTSTPHSSPSTHARKNNPNDNSNHSSRSFNSPSTTLTDTSILSFNSVHERQQSKNQHSMRQDGYKMAYLVLGCKKDLESQRQVSYEDGKAFADRYGFKFIETSSRMHYNVNQAFQLLAEEIYDKISECGRANRLHRTASGGHLTFDGASSYINEGIRIGPLIEANSRRFNDRGFSIGSNGGRVRLLEAQPVSGFLGGCC